MKLLLIFAFLTLVCIARSAPSASSTPRALILPDYHVDEEVHVVDDDGDSEEDMNSTTTTTTTTTTRRPTYVFPTRFRSTSRQPWRPQRTSSVQTTTTAVDETLNEYENVFKRYFKNVGKFFKKIYEDFKKFIRKLTGYDTDKAIQKFISRYPDD